MRKQLAMILRFLAQGNKDTRVEFDEHGEIKAVHYTIGCKTEKIEVKPNKANVTRGGESS